MKNNAAICVAELKFKVTEKSSTINIPSFHFIQIPHWRRLLEQSLNSV